MNDPARPRTGAINAALWGARAADWAEVQEPTVRVAFEAVLAEAGVGPGTAYLDIGCGAGFAAQLAAARGAQVSGTDAAEPLLAIGRERVPAGTFRAADLEELPWPEASFDVVTAFNAVQYAGSPAAALAEVRRVLRPDGVAAITVWGDPAGMDMAAVITALGPLLPPPPPDGGGPFALSDPAALTALARSGGLVPDRVFDVAGQARYPDLPTALRGLNASGVAARAIGLVGEEAVSRAHAAALAPFRAGDGSYVVGVALRCLLARPAPR